MYRDDEASRAARALTLRRDIAKLEQRFAKLQADRERIGEQASAAGIGRFRGLVHWWTIGILLAAFLFGAGVANQLITRDRTVEKACPSP